METVLIIAVGFLVFLAILPIARALLRGTERTISAVASFLDMAAKAGPAVVVSIPMLLHPEDIPGPWQPWSALDLDAPVNVVARWKVRAIGLGGVCGQALARSRARASFLPDAVETRHCHIRDRVRLSGLSKARLSSVDTQCEIAARLYLWERNVLQPAARRLLGSGVARIEHFSSYSCRKMNTSRGTSSRWSQHATANAIDIAGFVLSDGRRISVLKGWKGGGAQAAFLREARDGLCEWFNIVLSPDYNALHADHFHADMGPFLTCR